MEVAPRADKLKCPRQPLRVLVQEPPRKRAQLRIGAVPLVHEHLREQRIRGRRDGRRSEPRGNHGAHSGVVLRHERAELHAGRAERFGRARENVDARRVDAEGVVRVSDGERENGDHGLWVPDVGRGEYLVREDFVH